MWIGEVKYYILTYIRFYIHLSCLRSRHSSIWPVPSDTAPVPQGFQGMCCTCLYGCLVSYQHMEHAAKLWKKLFFALSSEVIYCYIILQNKTRAAATLWGHGLNNISLPQLGPNPLIYPLSPSEVSEPGRSPLAIPPHPKPQPGRSGPLYL